MSLKLPALALLTILGLTGCVVTHDGGGGSASDVFSITLDPTFAGTANCITAGVDQVRASFQSDVLQPVTVPCDNSAGIAINYPNVLRGTYTVTLQGLSRGAVAYQTTVSFTVDANQPTEIAIDLPVAQPQQPSTTLQLNFSFAGPSGSNTGGMTCAEAQVSNVLVKVDNATVATVPCHDAGSNLDSAVVSGIATGTHTLELDVKDSHGNLLYGSRYDNIVIASGANEYDVNVLGSVNGQLQITWSFPGNLSCAQAGVTTIEYQLVDDAGQAAAHGAVACADASGNNGVVTLSTSAGIYSLSSLVGRDNRGNARYGLSQVASGLYVPAGATQAWSVALSAQ